MHSDLDFLLSLNDKRKTDPPPVLISEYIQGRRVLPQDTPFPGPLDLQKVPYTIEILDCFSPHSPVQHVAVMKGAQIALTTTAENVLGYWMDANPSPILMLSATQGLISDWSDKRLEPLIDSIGMRSKIVSQQENNKKSRKSGDTTLSKSFYGGYLKMASAQSAAQLRSFSFKLVIRDEIDGAPKDLRTGEGNWLAVSEARTVAFGARKKIFDLSTPTTVEESAILQQYERGDKRKYEVPCPHCGEFQVFEFGGDKEMYGLKPVFDESGALIDTHYMCKHCHELIYNHHKGEMLRKGRWIATKRSLSRTYRSYHISSLYSPPGMLSWRELYQKYLDAKETPDGMRSFVNLYLGKPFRETGSRPKIENIINLRSDYAAGTVPNGVIFLTMAVDVQRGSETDPANPPRLEVEIRGHGRLWRTWSVSYLRIEGDIDSPSRGAWKKLQEFANNGGLVLKNSAGISFPVRMVFIDSGDGVHTETVYAFCQTWNSATFPIKGYNAFKKNRETAGDTAGSVDYTPFKAKKVNENTTLIEISTNHYKNHIYNNLHRSYLHRVGFEGAVSEEMIQKEAPAGFASFPIDYPERYFQMLTAEEKRSDGSFHAGGRRNEALDLAVYNSAAGDYFLNTLVMQLRVAHKQSGGRESELAQINHAFAFDFLEMQVFGRQ